MNWRKIALQRLPRRNIFQTFFCIKFLINWHYMLPRKYSIQNQSLALVQLQDAKTSFMYVITEAKSF